jgi:hypothetical protein
VCQRELWPLVFVALEECLLPDVIALATTFLCAPYRFHTPVARRLLPTPISLMMPRRRLDSIVESERQRLFESLSHVCLVDGDTGCYFQPSSFVFCDNRLAMFVDLTTTVPIGMGPSDITFSRSVINGTVAPEQRVLEVGLHLNGERIFHINIWKTQVCTFLHNRILSWWDKQSFPDSRLDVTMLFGRIQNTIWNVIWSINGILGGETLIADDKMSLSHPYCTVSLFPKINDGIKIVNPNIIPY